MARSISGNATVCHVRYPPVWARNPLVGRWKMLFFDGAGTVLKLNESAVTRVNPIVKRGLPLIVSLCIAIPLGAQAQSPEPEALRWSIALGGRFRDLRDPVVAAHAIGNLAMLMCPHDRTSAAALFQESFNRLRFLTPDSFRLPDHLLPSLSFTALWEATTAAAEKCDPDLRRYFDVERAQLKMRLERQKATDTLKRGNSLIESRPDRAAQLAEAALGVSDPASLDISELTKFLSDLRERAPDLADEVFDAALEFITSDSQNRHPVDAYSAAVQVLHESKGVAPDLVYELQQIIQRLAPLVGARAESLNTQYEVGPADLQRPSVLTASADSGTAITRVFHAIRSRNFRAARAVARGLSAGGALGQVSSIIDFAEAANEIERGDLVAALPLANALAPGIKRSLLYSAMTAASKGSDLGLGILQLAYKDAEPMAAEHRMIVLSAAAHAVLPKDLDNGLVALKLLVEAENDAARRPRKAFFNPSSAQRVFSGEAASGTDTSLVLFNRRCLCEVVVAREGRIYFGLKILGANVFRLADVVRNAAGADPLRLEAILLSLRNERQMAEALLALAELRLPPPR